MPSNELQDVVESTTVRRYRKFKNADAKTRGILVVRGVKTSVQRVVQSIVSLFLNLGILIGSGLTRLLPTKLWLGIRNRAVVVRKMDYPKAPIYLSIDSSIELDIRTQSCKKETDTVAWVEGFQPGDVFYDVGANVGAYSLVAWRCFDGQVKVHAFEPGFLTFPQLCKNIQLNNAHASILPFQVALSDKTGVAEFHYQNLMPGGALHALGHSVDQFGKPFQPVLSLPTASYRLDDFVQIFDLDYPNYIKIDVDGIEFQILQGAETMLQHEGFKGILMEAFETRDADQKIADYLAQFGLVLDQRTENNNLIFSKRSQ